MAKKKMSKNEKLLKELRRDLDKAMINPSFTWSMDTALEYVMWKGFKSFSKAVAGHPMEYLTLEDWQRTLDEQARLWKYVYKHHFDVDVNKEMNVTAYRQRALKFLTDNWNHLWW